MTTTIATQPLEPPTTAPAPSESRQPRTVALLCQGRCVGPLEGRYTSHRLATATADHEWWVCVECNHERVWG